MNFKYARGSSAETALSFAIKEIDPSAIVITNKVIKNISSTVHNQIDNIVITDTMIYVVECKSDIKRLKGNRKDRLWAIRFKGTRSKASSVYKENFVIQNEKHVNALKRDLKPYGLDKYVKSAIVVSFKGDILMSTDCKDEVKVLQEFLKEMIMDKVGKDYKLNIGSVAKTILSIIR